MIRRRRKRSDAMASIITSSIDDPLKGKMQCVGPFVTLLDHREFSRFTPPLPIYGGVHFGIRRGDVNAGSNIVASSPSRQFYCSSYCRAYGPQTLLDS
jgi:hypothetical protein